MLSSGNAYINPLSSSSSSSSAVNNPESNSILLSDSSASPNDSLDSINGQSRRGQGSGKAVNSVGTAVSRNNFAGPSGASCGQSLESMNANTAYANFITNGQIGGDSGGGGGGGGRG